MDIKLKLEEVQSLGVLVDLLTIDYIRLSKLVLYPCSECVEGVILK
jgi:hypothetical protein